MTSRPSLPIAVLCLAGALACGGGGGGGGGDGGGGGGTAECDKAANVARRAELLAAQPELVVTTSSGKSVRTFQTGFASVAGDPTAVCSVSLRFKDLNDDSALQPYEDWTRTAAARAQDLVGRMTAAQKRALMAHAVLGDSPSAGNTAPSAATNAAIDAGLRFGRTTASGAQLQLRAEWANRVQARAEASALGIPFVISTTPAHSTAKGRTRAYGFSVWPNELALGATRDLALVRRFAEVVSQEYRAIGVRMALSPVANLATEPRWFGSQFTFGEDPVAVSSMVEMYVEGLQSTIRGQGVAAVIGQFPGAGAVKGGFDTRLAKSKATVYPGNQFDAHVAPFQRAIAAGAAGIMTGYGIAETGGWTGLAGLVNGSAIEQVGASFSPTLLTTVLRGHLAFGGLVVAPEGVVDAAGGASLGAPWGLESATRAQRVAAAVAAGVDQFVGLDDTADLDAAGLSAAQVDAAATRALALVFRLGLFENPYVEPAKAPQLVNTDLAYQAGLDAMNRGMVLLLNKQKPAGWLNGEGDGTQSGDKGNAGNGTMRVLPAPPGIPYGTPGCNYFIAGDFDLGYLAGVSTGYGHMTNDDPSIGACITGGTAAGRMALSDYIIIRIAAPYTYDTDSGFLDHALSSLEYGGNDAGVLAPVAAARAAIDDWAGPCGAPSKAQIVVIVDAGRPSVVSELLSGTYGISGLYVDWTGQGAPAQYTDKVALDVAFGIVDGRGRLPVGLPASDAAASAQHPDAPGDGHDATLVRGFGIDTNKFF